jgi:D-glycero-alpha-D-manno-heptose-7-phosphate kinase
VSQVQIAEEACRIEIDRLGEPVGKQDQYIAAVGGITAFQFRDDDTVGMERLPLDMETRDRLEEELLLFYTGIRRSASRVLESQATRTLANESDIYKNLDSVRELGYESYDALVAGDLGAFGRLMTTQWRLKLERSPSEVHQRVDKWIEQAIEAGASGAKLVGAGDGGFLLVHTTTRAPVRRALHHLGLEEVRFGFDHEGTTTIVN